MRAPRPLALVRVVANVKAVRENFIAKCGLVYNTSHTRKISPGNAATVNCARRSIAQFVDSDLVTSDLFRGHVAWLP